MKRRNMKTIQIALIVAFFIPKLVLAKLDETVKECDQRYGTPIFTRDDSGIHERFYMKEGYFFQVWFKQEKAFHIRYGKYDKEKYRSGDTKSMVPLKLNDTEVELVLKANSNGLTWTQDDQVDSLDSRWVRKDRKAAAILTYMEKHLIIVSLVEVAKSIKEEKKEKEETLKDFLSEQLPKKKE